MALKRTYKNDTVKFYRTLDTLEQDPNVEKLKDYSQHKGNPTFSHCHSVAVSSFRLAQHLGWDIDEGTLARGAMLHDYHLYNYKDEDIGAFDHARSHPQRALENAERHFNLNGKERNIIRSHMWPLTLLTPPRSKEAVLVMLADKYCAVRELSRHLQFSHA